MNFIRREIAMTTHSKKKKLLKSSKLRILWNYIGLRKTYYNCFGGCGDNLWWKQNMNMAYQRCYPGDSLKENRNILDASDKDTTIISYKHGVMICFECFVKKSEPELKHIFEEVKLQWLKNKTNPEDIKRIQNYQLFVPIRTTKGMFKREMTEKPKSNLSSSFTHRIRKYAAIAKYLLRPNSFTEDR